MSVCVSSFFSESLTYCFDTSRHRESFECSTIVQHPPISVCLRSDLTLLVIAYRRVVGTAIDPHWAILD